jgi:LmbE family N-acetylglucosaminyl deacetylase
MRRIWITLMAGAGLALALVVPSNEPLRAQSRVVAEDSGHAALGLALRRLNTTATFLQVTAHPDDENNGLLAWLSRGRGMRTVLFTLTRGNGGQNEIGPELFEDLAVVRTSELEAVHRYDGAEQYFARAVDFGFSFSTEETFRKWGKEEILGDVVRMIRTIRPDVITAMRPDGTGGGQHHQASALLAQEAFRAAADPARYPEQVSDGLRPWQAKKLYFMVGFSPYMQPPPGMKVIDVDSNVYDGLLGRTYADIGAEARTMHKCQGMGQFLPLPGPQVFQYHLADTTIPGELDKTESGLFDGVDTTPAALVAMAGPNPPPALISGVAAISEQAVRAQKAFASSGDEQTLSAIATGLAAVRSLRAGLSSMNLADAARYDIGSRLGTLQRDFESAALLAAGISIDAISDDGLVYGGQPLKVTVLAVNRGSADVSLTDVKLQGFTSAGSCKPATVAGGAVYSCASDVNVLPGAGLTAPYWHPIPGVSRSSFDPGVPFGVPFAPSPFRAIFRLRIGDTEFETGVPVAYRYTTDIFTGEKRMDLHVVPAFAVRVNPETAIVPAPAKAPAPPAKPAAGPERTVFVTVINGTKSQAAGSVSMTAPAGWLVTPASVPVRFSHEDEALTVRFSVKMPAAVAPGDYTLKAAMTSPSTPGRTFDQGYQVVEYPHIRRRHVLHDAVAVVKVLGVKTTPNVSVGYIMGVGDVVPDALEQIGAKVTLIDTDELAWGDLSKYQVIFTGIRAYERRQDLRAYNRRLLDYAESGGTVIVQYNKMEFNEAQYGPYPARVSSSRATDENAPVMLLVPANPIFNVPNKVTEATWKGWVQERGLYFLGEKDGKYVDLLQIDEPFEYNKGLKKGALVEARFGKGRWIYVGLGLWRQVLAGTPGAYELLANMVTLGKVPPGAAELLPAKK